MGRRAGDRRPCRHSCFALNRRRRVADKPHQFEHAKRNIGDRGNGFGSSPRERRRLRLFRRKLQFLSSRCYSLLAPAELGLVDPHAVQDDCQLARHPPRPERAPCRAASLPACPRPAARTISCCGSVASGPLRRVPCAPTRHRIGPIRPCTSVSPDRRRRGVKPGARRRHETFGSGLAGRPWRGMRAR